MKRILALLVLVLLVPVAEAGVRPLTLAQKCKNATRIVRGTITASQARWAGSLIVTDWTLAPLENLKGAGTSSFNVTTPGGTLGGLTLRASEAPRMAVGEDVILYLRAGVGPCDVYGWYRGKYTVVNGKIREQKGTTVDAFLASIRSELAKQAKEGK